ncbi:hypothetical protein [Methylobacterium sp. SyP6R]|uniref:hypothetical protein n=1 Tax=Methylobacterium sp. SyP6R TaxID=2718876 RepID=UPI001F1E30B9|nr:hypothetical protein [Methylobacterium sp. SyP6R]MCF4128618.1 hypothetical protein [Methylobacterium sp. SyP6R]
MNALLLTASVAAISTASTLPSHAQEIRTPFGILHMRMNTSEAETALKSSYYTTEHGAIIFISDFNGITYYVSFHCPGRSSQCDKNDMEPTAISAIYTNEIGFDIRPRKVDKILENFGLDDAKARYDTDCAFWNTTTTIMNVGRVCGGWGIRMRDRKLAWGVPLGGFTPCTEGCF